MTDWCKNTLRVTGPDPLVGDFLPRAKGKYRSEQVEPRESPLCFETLVPLPSQATYLDELAEWGCKWGAFRVHLSETAAAGGVKLVEYLFDTAWSPPLELLNRVATLFPNLVFELEYYAATSGFAGKAKWEEGKLVFDKCGAAPGQGT